MITRSAHFIGQSFIDFIQISSWGRQVAFHIRLGHIFIEHFLRAGLSLWCFMGLWYDSHTSRIYSVTPDYRVSLWSWRSLWHCSYATAWTFYNSSINKRRSATRLPFVLTCVHFESPALFLAINLFYGPSEIFPPKMRELHNTSINLFPFCQTAFAISINATPRVQQNYVK